ncbi:MAG: hypothetical protein ACC669_12615, partial [bacterium]
PVNMPVIEQDGKKKYVVYLYDFEDAVTLTIYVTPHDAGGFASAYRCKGDPFTFIAIDKAVYSYRGKKVAGVAAEKRLYATLAHELFHAVQFTYDIKFGSIGFCSGPIDRVLGKGHSKVVTEGMAEGAAVYVTNQRWPEFLRKSESPKRVGLYLYRESFLEAQPDGKDGQRSHYRTSSFWRNLAERFGGLAFLGHLLKQPIVKNPSSNEVQDWLQRGLKSWPQFGWGMYTVFPAFLTELMASAGVRYGYWNEVNLVKEVFDGCEGDLSGIIPIVLTPEEPVQKFFEQMINKVAGRCFVVRWRGFSAPIELEVEARSQSRSLLDQVHLGIARARIMDGRGENTDFNCYKWLSKPGRYNDPLASCEYEKTFVGTGPTPGTYVKRWIDDPEKLNGVQGEVLFVLTNVAPGSNKTFAINKGEMELEVWGGIKYTKSEISQ